MGTNDMKYLRLMSGIARGISAYCILVQVFHRESLKKKWKDMGFPTVICHTPCIIVTDLPFGE